MSKLVHGFAFETPKFYIAPYDMINHGLVNLTCKCDVKSGLRVQKKPPKMADFDNCIDPDNNS